VNGWPTLLGNALCVLSLAIVLSTLSYAHWEARERGMHFRVIMATYSCQIACELALLLLSMGLSLSARSPWERICWVLFALLYTGLNLREWLLLRAKAQVER
jgi:hypothetical protein